MHLDDYNYGQYGFLNSEVLINFELGSTAALYGTITSTSGFNYQYKHGFAYKMIDDVETNGPYELPITS